MRGCCKYCVRDLPENKNAIYRSKGLEFCNPRCKAKFLEENKPELQIAKDYVKESLRLREQKLYLEEDVKNLYLLRGNAESHLLSCKRFLEFLEYPHIKRNSIDIKDKIIDLKNAIKYYEKNGLRNLNQGGKKK